MKDAIRVFTVVLIFGVIAPGQYADLNKAADTAVILAYTSGPTGSRYAAGTSSSCREW